MISLFKVFMASDVADYILPVLSSGYIGDGPKVIEFENKLGEFICNPNIVMLNSGTTAITMALKLCGVGRGDKVVTTPMTCLATNEPILNIGAVPLWADIDRFTGVINPDSIDMAQSPKAIVCMDWGGVPCDVDRLKEFGIPVIEDACQALGSFYKGKPVGNHADFVCLSFQAVKFLTTADGGAIVINDNPDLLEKARLMKWFGLNRFESACEQDPMISGYKWQSNDVLASIGLANIRHLSGLLNKTRENARRYNEALQIPDREGSSYWLYTLIVNDPAKFIEHMRLKGITCSRVHTRNDTKAIFKKFRNLSLPGVDFFEDHHVCIPVGWWLTEVEIEYIIKELKKIENKFIGINFGE